MKSLDLINQEKAALSSSLAQALQSGNEAAAAEAFTKFADGIQQSLIQEAQSLSDQYDQEVMIARGVRALTGEETKFYQKVISAMKSGTPQQALSNIEIAMPETVMESVFEDLRTAHPLLNEIVFVNTMAKIKMIVNKTGMQLAAWGPLHSAITKELEGSIGEVDTGLKKLTAFMPVSMDMLDLGPSWVDRYIREILSESIAQAMENAIVNGDGNNSPIGMTRSVADDVVVTGGVYPMKTAIAITDLSPTTYGNLLSKLAKAPNGRTRAITTVIFIVNPVDYYKQVMPCITVQGADGLYRYNVLPHPTTIVQSAGVPEGKAVIGIAKRYFMGVGSGTSGNIEYSDEFKFLEDQRVYKIKLHGNGMPLDDNAFLLLDISGLKPTVWKVNNVGATAGN